MTIKVGEKIKSLRREKDITQDRLAEYLGVTAQAVSRWESETCYPDIEIIPAIADFFDVTIDDLLCVDSLKKDAKINEYIDEANKAQYNGDFGDAVQIYRRALREYPSSFRLQVELACAIGAIDNNERISKDFCDEVIGICARITEDCTDDLIRLRAKAILCFVYARHLNDMDKALQIAEEMPGLLYACREITMAETLHIYLPDERARKNIVGFIGTLLILLNNPIGYKANEKSAECIEALMGELKRLKL